MSETISNSKNTKIQEGCWEIDIKSITCTCPHFKFRLKKFPKDSPERLCKHLKLHESKLIIPKPKPSKSAKNRHSREKAEFVVKKLELILCRLQNILKWEFCGSYRRKKETVGDLDLLLCVDPTNENLLLSDTLALYAEIKKIAERTIEKGPSKARFVIDGIQVDIRNVEEIHWPFALMHFTGSMDENIRLRAKASKMGLILNEYALREVKSGKSYVVSSEEEIYSILNEPYKRPEDR